MIKSAAKRMKQRSTANPTLNWGSASAAARPAESHWRNGDKLGVSFQRSSKYEKGINRVGAARLQQSPPRSMSRHILHDGDGKAGGREPVVSR
jgi:hypothetical protein